jgi:hypothetical protein
MPRRAIRGCRLLWNTKETRTKDTKRRMKDEVLRTTLFDGVLTKLFDGDIAVTITDII